MAFIAPQAYTKETLVKAFDWLQHQPASLKQVATSPDVLVGLFLKAQRQGINNIDADAPVSSKKFIDDLKNLKKDFAQFDDPNAQAPYTPPVPTPQPVPQQPPIPQGATAVSAPPSFPSAPVFSQTIPTPSYNVLPQQASLPLDENSLAMLNGIQQRFNLSTPQEALRMVISVGFQHISRWQ
jgi:hypothetical protein